MNKKYKVMNQKPEATDEEIKSYMNFEGLMSKRAEVLSSSKRLSATKWIVSGVVIVAALIATVWVLETRTEKVEIENTSEQNDLNEQKETVTAPSEVESIPAGDSISPIQSQTKEIAKQNQKVKKETAAQKATPVDEAAPENDSYVQAEPVNGYPDLYEYLSKNMVYPKEAIKDSIQGVSTISFVINKNGKPERMEIVNSLGPLFDAEAKRLVESMPAWKPAVMNGKPVPSKISLPVTFQLVRVKAH